MVHCSGEFQRSAWPLLFQWQLLSSRTADHHLSEEMSRRLYNMSVRSCIYEVSKWLSCKPASCRSPFLGVLGSAPALLALSCATAALGQCGVCCCLCLASGAHVLRFSSCFQPLASLLPVPCSTQSPWSFTWLRLT